MSSQSEPVSKRFSIVLPDELDADLQKWADGEGRPKANLASFILETAIKMKYREKYPPVVETQKAS